MDRKVIHTDKAPRAIGTYSQAILAGDTVYLSGQIGLDPESMQLAVSVEDQIHRVFRNLAAVAEASGGGLQDVVRLTIYMTDLSHFPKLNEIMADYFREPYPARVTVGVAALPRGAAVEMDAVMILPG